LAFLRGVLACEPWTLGEKWALLRTAGQWSLDGFRCAPEWTVQKLCASLPDRIALDLMDPLCVAALNTPMAQASASVFLRVLKDALFSGPGSADLLLPKVDLSSLLVDPALKWLANRGVQSHLGHRVKQLERSGQTWKLDNEPFDAVVLACSATEAARLTWSIAPSWAACAQAIRYEPIVTAYLAEPDLRFTTPMQMLRSGHGRPAQFAFDLGTLQGRTAGLFAFVASGASAWLENGLASCAELIHAQARQAYAGCFEAPTDQVVKHIAAERRATFACTPGLLRPVMRITDQLMAAGDYVEGPYPATLEGAVRSGQSAARALGQAPGHVKTGEMA
jgi:hypothetical protein